MARKTTIAPPNVVERNISLVGQITQYLLDHPEICRHNLELLDEVDTSKSIVFARVHARQDIN